MTLLKLCLDIPQCYGSHCKKKHKIFVYLDSVRTAGTNCEV